jgi:UDP-N-acetylmuramoyl-tripeptide--D-alanyl-D-alanine ligase
LPSGALELETVLVGKQGAITALAAVTVGDLLGLSREKLQLSLPKVLPYAGRMQILAGQKSAVLIDDTYNAAPKSFKAALDVLYAANATQRIAILGSINEMGDLSEAMHQEVGEYCDPTKLNLVVTIGRDAERWLAPIAKAKGCTVVSFSSPYQAGNYVLTQMQTGAVVLAKGSQNGVFAEEALKQLLEKPADNEKLVRQSDYWMAIKEKQFKDAL